MRRQAPLARTVRRSRNERGAALFIVVMVVALLTAIGVFSARSASLVDVASGYNRQSVQTLYVTEYGTRTVVAELGVGTVGSYYEQMAKGTDTCTATKNVVPPVAGAPIACYKLFMQEIANRIDANFAGQTVLDPSGPGLEGSLGPKILDASQPWTTGNFVVEMTDPGPPTTPEAGSDVGGTGTSFIRRQVTLTGTGQTRPFAAGNACDESSSAAAAVLSMRAFVTIGPLPATGG